MIACKDATALGQPTQTNEGLTCGNGQHGVHLDFDFGEDKTSSGSEANAQGSPATAEGSKMGFNLRTGSPDHQIVVSFGPHGSGTTFTLSKVEIAGDKSQSSAKAD